ncbi:hypothetical protein BX600DRAFT_483400 [Xylariales sp. PMI_506]|nr:hypothetical protein BX600DRAFT_483400 [Xylariales sp. PMI_506]
MRLLKLVDDGRITLSEWLYYIIPPYAILSHTWGTPGEEVLFHDILNGAAIKKKGHQKTEFCAKQAASDSSELSESINSMFRWYQNAARCYVYLSDVSAVSEFEKSRWVTRGWTLQELLAPRIVEFLSSENSLETQIHDITRINTSALRGLHLSDFPAFGRQTSEEEDIVYCLLGVFGVFLPLIYGQGKMNARMDHLCLL